MKDTGTLTKSQMILSFMHGTVHCFVLAAIFTCLASLFNMIRPKIIEYTVDVILSDGDSDIPAFVWNLIDALGGVDRIRHALWIPALGVILCTLLFVLCNYVYQMNIAKGGEAFVKQMRDQLFQHIEKLSTSWHASHQTGDIIQRCTDDVEEVKAFLSDQLVTLIQMIVTIILSLVFMFRISWQLGLASFLSVPVLIGLSVWFHGRIGSSFRICDENEAVLSTIAQENLTGVRVVRAFGREAGEKERFSVQNKIVTKAWVDLGKYFSIYISAGDVLTGAVMVAVLSWGSALCLNRQLTVGALLAVITYVTILIRPVRSMGRVLSEMSKTGVSISRLHEIMKAEEEADPEDACEAPMDRDIVFDHVSFAYPGQPRLLSDLNFTIPAGSTLGILGGTGSGKSTIAHLLTRLYPLDPEWGKITVGGVDIAQMKAGWVRKNIGFVMQESFLFSRSIRENIGITRPDMTESDMRQAARTACLEKAVDEFPSGFDTFVGERGVTLSGGQKQRAAIARTLSRGTPILIFDDSLSAVDAETDAEIRENLKKQMGSVTMIIISHRISTLMAADQILVLDDGKIIDRGSHAELIDHPGLYRKIYNIQTGKEEE